MSYKLTHLFHTILDGIDHIDRVTWIYIFSGCLVIGLVCMRGYRNRM